MKRQGRLFKTDNKIVLGAIIGILICLYLLLFDDGAGIKNDSARLAVGKVTFKQNDARQKYKTDYSWDKVKEQQTIRLGDSIYSGQQSQIQVSLDAGGAVDIGENSLVTFDTIQDEKVVDLSNGNFRLKVNGTMKIALQGEIATFEGDNSELQVVIGKDNKTNIRLLKGEATVKKANKVMKLNPRSIASINGLGDELPSNQPTQQPPPPPQAQVEIPVVDTGSPTLEYKWKLYDIYEPKGLEVFEKKYRPHFVKMNHRIDWKVGPDKITYFEWTNDPAFTNAVKIQTRKQSLEMPHLYIGENYWKVSTDNMNWSASQRIVVEADFLKDAEPEVVNPPKEITLFKETVSINVPLKTSFKPIGFVAQASTHPQFAPDATKTFWSAKPDVRVSFFRPGVYYYRFRSVNERQEISRWSKPVSFHVVGPEKALVPKLARLPKQKPKPKVIIERPVKQAKAEEPKQARQVASTPESTSLIKIDKRDNVQMNDKYKSSQVAVQGFMWTMQSTDLLEQGGSTNIPVASGLGVHSYLWRGNHGFEGNFKSGVLAMNTIGQEIVNVQALEARYHYRIFTGFPFGLSRELQTSLFAGYEVYRNTGIYVSREYDLVKFGTALEFPWYKRWSSGGEFVYGRSSDASVKYEVSGNLNYFLNTDWSFGVGYRIHLFDAGSLKSSPTQQLPYREGYTEGFSNLIYYF